ncbi:MAG: mechanosensitive ion channel [Desulfobacterales bacterium]
MFRFFHHLLFLIVFAAILSFSIICVAQEEKNAATGTSTKPSIAISEDMDDIIVREASRVKEEFKQQAKSLFAREKLDWNWKTIEYLSRRVLDIFQIIPQIIQHIGEQSRILGLVGSMLMLIFILVLLYSIFGQRRLMRRIVKATEPFRNKIPEQLYPFFISAIRIVVTALIPLLLLGVFLLIDALIDYKATWFQLVRRFLVLWAIGSLIINLLRESLTRDLFQSTAQYGKQIFRISRLVLLFILFAIAIYWSAEVFGVREDVLAFMQFVVAVSIVLVLFLFLLKRKAFISLFPELPHRTYQVLVSILKKFYYPIMLVSFIAALLWCFGYQRFGQVVLTKIWTSTGAFLLIMILYQMLQSLLQKWSARLDPRDEAATFLSRSMKSLLLYVTVTASGVVILNLLGLLNPLQQLMSFPVVQLGESQVTFWTIIKAILILMAFIYATRLLQAYLDYKVYPSLGVDPGLGYAINIFFKYVGLAIGFLISLKVVGIDLRFLLVFAGALGIGIGLGLQNMAANVISGFSIVFGGKIRKGDWIEVSDTLGVVTDIYLRATKIRTRDNIEYLVPNSNLISDIVVNYSLSSSFIRVEMPIGVSYDADPRQVEQIFLEAAREEPDVSNFQKPAVRFIEYGDNSINFVLLIWIDVRKTPRRRVRSALYFSIFDKLKKAGIEIPFPQRDIHIRSTVEQKTASNI